MIKVSNAVSVLIIAGVIFINLNPGVKSLWAQEKKGELEDFADDFGEENSEDEDSDSADAVEFFLIFFDNFADFVRLWGQTPGTEFGPYPSFPYADGDGFMADSHQFRSYFFNTEFTYHHLSSNLRSYLLKWETQFIRSSKLAFDLAVYEEDLFDPVSGVRKDKLVFYGLRYGHALFRSPHMLFNLEGGFRGFLRNRAHGGVEAALDLQLFPKKPLVIETEVAAAYVTNGWLFTVESSAGILLGRIELLAGLRILKNQSPDLLDGFRVGLRIWY
jgi:hypothetical protein